MSKRYLGGVITANSVTPTGSFQDSAAPGMWTSAQQMQLKAAGLWPLFGNVNPSQFIENLFSTYLYTGNSSTQTITNGIDLAGKGGLVWIKDRAGPYTYGHFLFDTTRGTNKYLRSEQTSAQGTLTNALNSFNANGFSLGSNGNVNDGGAPLTYVSWTFREQPKFFDVVTYTGNDTAGRQIPHNLGSAPGCIIIKDITGGGSWVTYHRSLGATKYILLNDTGAAGTFTGFWNDTAPTSTEFTLGSSGGVNSSASSYVAYLFAHDAGGFGLSGSENVISCGSYTGNGAALGPAVNLGYEPQWILVKRASGGTSNWYMVDNMRGFVADSQNSYATAFLYSNASDPEGTTRLFNVTSTGFQAADSDPAWNNSGNTYIYIAIRRGPMAVPTLGTTVFSPISSTAALGTALTTGFPVDMQFEGYPPGDSTNMSINDRLRGVSTNATQSTRILTTSSTAAEASPNSTMTNFWGNTGFKMPGFYAGVGYISWNFRRAPSFFDEVCYTGTGVARTLTHNLGAVPELLIFKNRTNTGGFGWFTFSPAYMSAPSTTPYWNYLQLQSTAAAGDWGNNSAIAAAPTSSTISIGAAAALNIASDTNVLYLFATCPGVSKVGSYTGTGTTQAINCGFTTGARYVLIKRTDSTGAWYVWDSARGIVAGNDPYLLLNSTAAEVTGTDYVDTSPAGFEISSTAPAEINASGGSYIFLAIS